ncbi:MAG: citramalate synthase [Candidatus Levybacteria bacterium RIFCSPLOWO2_01_FULL_39_24]|nr:MAG: citramalate synthase [Candidatus Levybacteria bacterium RIFCSPHIGHO2_01_FULL_40_16]OGH28256.1 MAG: citramalate synthase [Candidatus Levybacteria bacterium RIFCSPHIGHO2_12_FULL_39_9]OGH46513.1 MAG: citramalate synthase [Candidatus Levybacteria bacterium RIFCSPLOWO2_01_FULL_39_24]
MKERFIKIYDTTLRDGAQTPGLTLTTGNKLKIAQKLADLGFHYIEGGWPGANPTDSEFFKRIKQEVDLNNSTLAAFGMTGRIGIKAEDDEGLQTLLNSQTGLITIFGKSWMDHVKYALKTTGTKNLDTIFRTVEFLRKSGRDVFYDAEHFFDGYKSNPNYALEAIRAAKMGGARVVILCDTNGGSIPEFIYKTTKHVKEAFPKLPLGIHVHNDGGLATVNTLAAVQAGASQVQGTVNGVGERAGNVDLCIFMPTAEFKYGFKTGIDLTRINELSDYVAKHNGFPVPTNAPYRKGSLTHKGGVHVSAQERGATYEHIDPRLVGISSHFEHSDQGGGANIISMAQKHGLKLDKGDPKVKILVDKMKQKQILGDAQELLLLNEVLCLKDIEFTVLPSSKTETSKIEGAKALIDVSIEGKIFHAQASGNGGLNAYDIALRAALSEKYPEVFEIKLVDYRVVLPPLEELGTDALVEVYVELSADGNNWTSRTRNVDQQLASQDALVEGYQYFLLKNAHE